jgi:alpha-amylase/alpha-mannosidase (GH57 family)
MEKIEKLIDEIGVDNIQDYIKNRKPDHTKEIKEFLLNEIQSCKPTFNIDGYRLKKNDYTIFDFNFNAGYLFYDYSKIYLVLYEKYKINETDLNKIIKSILVDKLKYDNLIPSACAILIHF